MKKMFLLLMLVFLSPFLHTQLECMLGRSSHYVLSKLIKYPGKIEFHTVESSILIVNTYRDTLWEVLNIYSTDDNVCDFSLTVSTPYSTGPESEKVANMLLDSLLLKIRHGKPDIKKRKKSVIYSCTLCNNDVEN